jgi:tetratricopeptide (TPR) repeat protein
MDIYARIKKYSIDRNLSLKSSDRLSCQMTLKYDAATPVFRRLTSISLLVLAGWIVPARIAQAQVYAPYLPPIETKQFDRDAALFLEEARQLAQIPQQMPLAILRAKLATQFVPRSAEAWAVLGGLYLLDNQPSESVKSLEKAKNLAPREPKILFRLGSAYFQTKQYGKAVAVLEAGLKLKPNIAPALFDLGNAYLLNQQVPQAIDIYNKAYAQDAKFWFPLNNIGIVRYDEGNVDESIRLWRACIAIDNQEAEPKMALAAALYVKKGDKTQGIKLASEAIKLNLRYSETQFMRDNLWGEKLIADTATVLADPALKAAIVQAQEAAATTPDSRDLR